VSLTGRGLEETADPPRAARLRALGAAALETGVPQEDFVPMHDEDACAFVTRQVPLVADGALPPAVLLIEHDVTGEVVERERCRDMLDAVVEMILGVIDQRDPYAAYHGWRLGLLAEVVAHELDADPATAETARLAGHLLMAGKALVPASMLSQDLELTPQERAQVQASLDATLEILEEVNFDGPVTRTLCQLQERVDGKGFPLGLPEGRILTSARILKVANAFLGLIDRQPGAPGLALDAALDELWRQAGFAYDARVVEALSRHLGSDEARDAWDPAAEAGSRRRPSA
jgi:HD-GYP domain-containing protein (c-di-GMP phosphodiesterase class II)